MHNVKYFEQHFLHFSSSTKYIFHHITSTSSTIISHHIIFQLIFNQPISMIIACCNKQYNISTILNQHISSSYHQPSYHINHHITSYHLPSQIISSITILHNIILCFDHKVVNNIFTTTMFTHETSAQCKIF